MEKCIDKREYLSKDILEEESLKPFAPIRFLQIVFGTCRVHVKHRFVTAPTVWQKSYSILCIVTVILSYIHLVYVHLYGYYKYQNMRFAAAIWLGVHLLGYTCNLIHNRFLNCEANAKFYVKLQRIDRIMKIDKNKMINGYMYTISVTIFILIVLLWIASTGMALSPATSDLIGAIGIIYSDYSFLTELTHCSQNIYYLTIRLRYINCIIVNYLEGNPVRSKPSNRKTKSKIGMLYIASLSHHFETSPVDVYFKELFNVFGTFRELYQFQVFLCYSRFIPLTVMGIYIILISIKNNIHIPLAHFLIVIFVTSFDILLLVILSTFCDKVINETHNTKRLCTSVMARNYDGPLRKKARKIIKMIENNPPHFSVYDMWITNSSTVLNMVNVITSLNITMLQFIYL